MPVWDIGGFTLLEGRLVLLGEEEVRKIEERKGDWTDAVAKGQTLETYAPPPCLSPLPDCRLLWEDRVLAKSGWEAPARKAACRHPWGTSGIQVNLGD